MNENYTVPPVPGERLDKKQAGYVDRGPFGCEHCFWFQRTGGGVIGSCKPIGNEPINERGCCNYWNDYMAPQAVGKAAAEYVYIQGCGYTCAECKYFDTRERIECWPVYGPISPGGSCNKFMP